MSRAAALSLPAARIVVAAADHAVHPGGMGQQGRVVTSWNTSIVQPGPAVALLHNWLSALQHTYDWTAHNHAVMQLVHGGFVPPSARVLGSHGAMSELQPQRPNNMPRSMQQSPAQQYGALWQHHGGQHLTHGAPPGHSGRRHDVPDASGMYSNPPVDMIVALHCATSGGPHGGPHGGVSHYGSSKHMHYGDPFAQPPLSQTLSVHQPPPPHMAAAGIGGRMWSLAPPARQGRVSGPPMLSLPTPGQPPASVLRLSLDSSQHDQLLPAVEEALNAAGGELGAPLTVQRSDGLISVSIQREDLFDWLESTASMRLASTGKTQPLEQLRAKPAVVDSLQMWMSEEGALRQWLTGEVPHFPRKAQNTAEVLGMTMSMLRVHANALQLPAQVQVLAMHALCVLLTHVNPSGSCVGDMEAAAAAMRPPAHAISGSIAAGAPVAECSAGEQAQDSVPVAGGAANSSHGMQTAFMSTSTTLSNVIAQVSATSNAVVGSDSFAAQSATPRAVPVMPLVGASVQPMPSHSSSWMWHPNAGSVVSPDPNASTVWGTQSFSNASCMPNLSWEDLHAAGSASRLATNDAGASANMSQRSVVVRSASAASGPAISGALGAPQSSSNSATVSGIPSGGCLSSGTSGLSQRLTGSSQASQPLGGALLPGSNTPPVPSPLQDALLAPRPSSTGDASAAPPLPPLPPRSGARSHTAATATVAAPGVNLRLRRRSPAASCAGVSTSVGSASAGSDVLATTITASSISVRTSCHAVTASLTSAPSDATFPVDPVLSSSQSRPAIGAEVSQRLSKHVASSGNDTQGSGNGEEGCSCAGLDLSEINATADALRAVSIKDGGIQGDGPAPPMLDTVIEVGSHSSRSGTPTADNACQLSGAHTLTGLHGASSSELTHASKPIAEGIEPSPPSESATTYDSSVHAQSQQPTQHASYKREASQRQVSQGSRGRVARAMLQAEGVPPVVRSACQRLAELCCAAASSAGPWPPFFLAQVCSLGRNSWHERISWSVSAL